MFSIIDEDHGDGRGEFASIDAAYAELRRLARIPWGEGPNRAPCISWAACGRSWVLNAPPDSSGKWREVAVLAITREGRQWSVGSGATPLEAQLIADSRRRWRSQRLARRAEHASRRLPGNGGERVDARGGELDNPRPNDPRQPHGR